jgi:hypothetical protein
MNWGRIMQKGLLISIVSSLAIVALLTPSLANALNIGDSELRIRPRLEGGLMYYEYEQDATLNITNVDSANLSLGDSKFKFKDTLPVVLGGVTFFIDRFFIELNAQKAFTGSDSDSQSSSFSFIDNAGVTNSELRDTRLDADFDRTEYAISVGYAINERIAVFAGYKRAKTEFDNVKGSGNFKRRFLSSSQLPVLEEGSIESDGNFDFEYDGPFVGVTYGLDVNKDFLKGVLSFGFVAAFLNSEFERERKGKIIYDDGFERTFEDDLNSKGETLGETLGLKWQGLIMQHLIKQNDNIGYSINVNAYQYNFEADDSDDPGIKETAINFRVGIGYAF